MMRELTLPVTLAVLGAALLHASWNLLVKSSKDKELDAYGVALGSGVIALLLLPFIGPPARAAWPWLVCSALVHVLYFSFLARAYRWGELSYVYPLMRGGGPMLVALLGVLLFGEALSPGEWLGVFVICGAILALASGAHDSRATGFALANAVVIATYTLIDGQGARASNAPVGYALWFFVLNGLVIGALGTVQRGRSLPRYFAHEWLRLAGGGACALGAYGIALWAMTRAPVALVAVLRETSVIFAPMFATVLLKEKLTRRRMAATGAVLLGLVILKI